mmetsp:Transcript_66162/g.197688  ORF Transcript_66162/g.197688 Transcript_66162/m.197688 type:complete len:265 (-) Transcript_66162:408-1202(-)
MGGFETVYGNRASFRVRAVPRGRLAGRARGPRGVGPAAPAQAQSSTTPTSSRSSEHRIGWPLRGRWHVLALARHSLERLVEPPVDVVGRLARLVLLYQRLHNLARLVKLAQIVRKHLDLSVIVEEGVPLSQLVVLLHDAVEEVADGRVVGEHQARDAVRRLHVRRLAREGDLDRRRPPRDERAELSLTDALQRLVHLRRVDFSLDDVEDRYVAAAVLARRARHHDVLRLQQPAHHVHHRRLAHRHRRQVGRVKVQRRVSRHEEV